MSEKDGHSTYPALLVRLMGRLLFIWEQMVLFGEHIIREFHLHEYMDMAAVYLVQHPVMAVIIFVMALCCGIPVLMFVLFAVLSVLLTFTGFIVIEGTILTIGSVLLCGFLLGMLLVMVALAATIGVAYLGFMGIYGLLQNSPENSPISHYISRHFAKQTDNGPIPDRPVRNFDFQHDNSFQY